MCILGNAGNRGGVRGHFWSALCNTHVRRVVDAVVCHPELPWKTKELSHQAVRKVGWWRITVPSLVIALLPSKSATRLKDMCPPQVSLHPVTGLWVGSRPQPPCLNSGQIWRITPVPELPVGSAEVSVMTTTPCLNISLCPILYPSFIPFQVFLRASQPVPPPPHAPLRHNKLPVYKSPETMCKVLILLGWRWWIDAWLTPGATASWHGQGSTWQA